MEGLTRVFVWEDIKVELLGVQRILKAQYFRKTPGLDSIFSFTKRVWRIKCIKDILSNNMFTQRMENALGMEKDQHGTYPQRRKKGRTPELQTSIPTQHSVNTCKRILKCRLTEYLQGMGILTDSQFKLKSGRYQTVEVLLLGLAYCRKDTVWQSPCF